MSSAKNSQIRRTESPVQEQSEWFGQWNQSAFDLDFYERVLSKESHDIRLLTLLGELHARQKCYARAVEIGEKLVALLPENAIAHYNLACALAMRGSPLEALALLQRALSLGYNDFAHLQADPDLECLRAQPHYQSLLRQFAIGPIK